MWGACERKKLSLKKTKILEEMKEGKDGNKVLRVLFDLGSALLQSSDNWGEFRTRAIYTMDFYRVGASHIC